MSVEEHSAQYRCATLGAKLADDHISSWLAANAEHVLLHDTIEQQFDAVTLTVADLTTALGGQIVDGEEALLNLREGYTFAVRAVKHLIQHDDRADHEWWLLSYTQWKALSEHYLLEAAWAMADINRAQGIEQILSWMKKKYEAERHYIVDAAFCRSLVATPQLSLAEAHLGSLELHTFTCREELEAGWVLGATVLKGFVANAGSLAVVGDQTYRLFNIHWSAQIAMIWRRP